ERNREPRRAQLNKAFKAWRKRNPRIVRAHSQVNKARKRANPQAGAFTSAEWIAPCGEYNYQCARCRQPVDLTPDHIVPLSRGGCNHIENIQPLCLPCNLAKGVQ